MPKNNHPQTPANQIPAEQPAEVNTQQYGLQAHEYVQIQCCSGKKCRKNDSERIINLFKVMLHAHGIDDMVDVVTSGCFVTSGDDVVTAGADVVSTGAEVVSTGADVVSTGADVVST